MPKLPKDYQNTIIYKLLCKDINVTDSYVGHTTNFAKRKHSHKTTSIKPHNKNYNAYVYVFIRNNGGFDNWDMIEIEKYPCSDKYEASKRERYWLEKLKATLNQRIPSRSKTEYTKDTKETRAIYKKATIKKIKKSSMKLIGIGMKTIKKGFQNIKRNGLN